MKHTAHRWLVAALLAASVMLVASAAASGSTSLQWPAKCKTVACVNAYLNTMHNSNHVRSTKIATLNGQMVTNNAQHAAFTEQMKGYSQDLAGYDKTIADMKTTIAGYDKTIADMKGTMADMQTTIALLQGRLTSLEKWQTALKANISHVDITVNPDGTISAVVKPTTPLVYMLLFEKASVTPPPIFP